MAELQMQSELKSLHLESSLRRSQRERCHTEVSLQYRAEQAKRAEAAFTKAYDSFKLTLVTVRNDLKESCTEQQLHDLLHCLEKGHERVANAYEELKPHMATIENFVPLQRRMDTASACTQDMLTHIHYRISEVDMIEFDFDYEAERLKTLKKPYAASIYSAVTSSSRTAESKSIREIAVETAADLAAKKARVAALEEQERDRIQLAQLESEKRQINEAIVAQQQKLELLKARQELEESDAKLRVLNAAVMEEENVAVVELGASKHPNPHVSQDHSHSELNPIAPAFSPPVQLVAADATVHTSLVNESTLATAMANAVDRNRLPVPTPRMFSGNPMDFVGFKRGFKTLIENKGISAEERIYYLQQYVTGDAREAIAGCFYGTDEAAYQHAWEVLEKRFGHPFRIQEAFRDKLDKWPKINVRDGIALQKYADFLQTCLDATLYVKDLNILNDCKENQRLAAKLPDWAITRWGRIVADSLDTAEYPTFRQFVAFVEKEARVACHPVASVHAVKGVGLSADSKVHTDTRGKSARSLAVDLARTQERRPASSRENGPGNKKSCPFCKEEHYLSDCKKFMEISLDDRNAFIQKDKRCFGCLRTGHFTKQCKVRHTCQVCKGRHPTVLHKDTNHQKPSQQNLTQNEATERAVSCYVDGTHSNTTNVIPVWVSTADNPQTEKLVYALLDTQSDSTFIDEAVCEELSAPTDPVKLKLSTLLGRDVTVVCRRAVGLRIRGFRSTRYIDLPPTFTRDFIPLDREHIPTCETARGWTHLASVVPEMPPLLDCDVGLLIGYNCSTALAPRQVIVGNEGQPYAVRTDLGWSIVGGSTSEDSTNSSRYCHRISLKEAPPTTPCDVLTVLESDFKDISCDDVSTSQQDMKFLRILEGNITMNSVGHLEMPLPFKTRPSMQNNRILAVRRLLQLKRQLDRNSKYKEQYTEFIEGMLREGHAEPATKETRAGEVNYIPHHGVYNSKKPGKLRVVFDCSARYQGESLNDWLLSGPDLTNNLFGVLCRFRRQPVAVMCDIEKMFHQFHVSPDDRNYLRFLWWEGGDTTKEPSEFRMNVHLFGATSSPGCANFGLKHLAKLFEKDYPLAAPFLCHDYYVDDGVTSLPSVADAVTLIKESRELCARGNLRLHKFISNARTVLDEVPLSERAAKMQKMNLHGYELPTERALGLQWDVEHDVFKFQREDIMERPNTRRGILATVASIYDPMGLISPFLLEGKAILQEICKQGASWDDLIHEDASLRWERWKADIRNLEELQIPRCYKPKDFNPITRIELHHFSDACFGGYGTCSYLRFLSGDQVHCCLVASKARVAPRKLVTIPRLELTAAVVAVKMSIKLKAELRMNIDSEFFWCDSQIVLAYINNDTKRFHLFVANRVQFIKNHTREDQWQYIPTESNPADHASRGLSAAQLLTSNWFAGPEILWSIDVKRSSLPDSSLTLGDPEVRAQAFSTQSMEVESNDLLERISKYSDWEFLTRIVARILRLTYGNKGSNNLTVDEINRAGLRVVKLVQGIAFKNEIQAIRRGQNIPSTSNLYNLDAHIEDGVLRVGGRLRNSSLPATQKYPIILPKDEHVTRLIIAYCHKQIHHQGRGQTLNEIRSRGYWILGGSRRIAEFIKNCVHCRRLRRSVEEQKMADLPEDRVEPSPPFSFCGMDCFGPFVTKQGRKEHKRYGLLFSCLCSRAVHIEMLEDMSTDSFIIGLRSFIAIRGTVFQIRSDQGSNFVGANNELASAFKELDMNRIVSFLVKKQCNFVFNAPCSSHAGGVWERQIRSIRNVLNSTLALSAGRLDDASLRCLFYEAMLIVNSRPLTSTSNDPSEEPITPNHLITMKSVTPLPPPGRFVKEDIYARKRWRRIQYLMEQFWSRWRKEYLMNLNERQRWSKPRRNVQVGDIVMITDVEVPRMKWPLAVVIEAQEDRDGLVRRIKARLGNSNLDRMGRPEKQASVLERPVQKIVVLLETR